MKVVAYDHDGGYIEFSNVTDFLHYDGVVAIDESDHNSTTYLAVVNFRKIVVTDD